MSFPRAKITRFNEKPVCSPSPADYNVRVQSNACGAVISRSERFAEPKSPLCSDNGSVKSINSTPCFRTPTLPKKKKSIFSSLSARRNKPLDLFKDLPDQDLEALKDKIVECNNKDQSIKDLTEQIEDMKQQLSNLTRQTQDVTNERSRFQADLADAKEEHRIVLQRVYLDHDVEVAKLRKEVRKLEVEVLEREEELRLKKIEFMEVANGLRSEVEAVKIRGEERLKEVLAVMEGLREELRLKKCEKGECGEALKRAEEGRIEKIKTLHKDEVRELEFEMLKAVTEMQGLLDKVKEEGIRKLNGIQQERIREVEELRFSFEEEKARLGQENLAKLKQVEENCKEVNLLAEMQMAEKFEDLNLTWKMRLENKEKESDAILKECQAISEYNIIQSEVEKKKIQLELDRKLVELEKVLKANADLEIKTKDLELKLNNFEQELERKNACDTFKSELQEALSQKKIYEMTISSSHQTIDALKKRLLDSDMFVEQLTEELENCEKTTLEAETKCNELSESLEELTLVHGNLQKNFERILSSIEQDKAQIEEQLHRKIEEYKAAARTEIDDLKLKLDLKENDLATALTQLSAQNSANLQAHELIARVSSAIDEDKISRDFLLDENAKLKRDVESFVTKEIELVQLEKAIVQLQEKSDSYAQYCEYYKGKSLEHERDLGELDGINKKYIEQSGKYDRLLQKFEALREENVELERRIDEQEKLIGPFREMEARVKAQARTIDKLKKELAALSSSPRKSKIQDKENLNSPNRTLNGTLSSPGPLREWN